MIETIVNHEFEILNAIQGIKCEFLNKFLWIFSTIANPVFIIIWLVLLVIFKKTRKVGIQATIAVLLGLLIGNLILKNICARERPFAYANAMVQAADLLVKQFKDFSFPSGHTMSAFNIAIVVFMNNKKAGIAALITASLVAFSRLYFYVHFPTDIIAGIMVSVICSIASFYIIKFLADRFNKAKAGR